MDIDKFIKDKGLKLDCIVESDLDVKEYVQYEVRDLIKEAVNKQQRELLIAYEKYKIGVFNCTLPAEIDEFLDIQRNL